MTLSLLQFVVPVQPLFTGAVVEYSHTYRFSQGDHTPWINSLLCCGSSIGALVLFQIILCACSRVSSDSHTDSAIRGWCCCLLTGFLLVESLAVPAVVRQYPSIFAFDQQDPLRSTASSIFGRIFWISSAWIFHSCSPFCRLPSRLTCSRSIRSIECPFECPSNTDYDCYNSTGDIAWYPAT